MHIYSIASLANTLVLGGLGLFVFAKKPDGLVQRWWLFLSLCATGWSFGTIWANNTTIASESLFWYRLLNYFATFVPYFFLSFVSIFIFDKKVIITKVALFISFSIFVLAILFPHLFVSGVREGRFFFFTPQPSLLYHFYTFYFFLCVIYCLFLLYRGFKVSKAVKKNQLKYLFLSMLVAFSGGGSTFMNTYGMEFPYGNFYFSLYALIMSYAIVAYRLMDIEVIIRKTLVFIGILVVAVCSISIPLGLIQLVIGGRVGITPFWLMISGMATTAFIYRPVARWLTNFTDNYLFQKKFDYQKLLKDASTGISQIKSLRHLLSLVVHFITMRVRVKSAAVLVYDDKNNNFRFSYPRMYPGGAEEKVSWQREDYILSATDPLIEYLRSKRQAIDLDWIKHHAERKTNRNGNESDLKLVEDRMAELNSVCAVPSFLSDRLLGVLLLGEKKSGDIYTNEDLNVLSTIAQESAIAIENARLYDQVLEKNRELEEKNVELQETVSKLDVAHTDLFRALKLQEEATKKALEAQKKTEELQTELLRRQRLLVVEQLVRGLSHEIFNAVQPMRLGVDFISQILKDKSTALKENTKPISDEDRVSLLNTFQIALDECTGLDGRIEHIFDMIDTLNKMRKGDDKTIGPFDFATFWIEAHNKILMQTHGEILEEVPLEENIPSNLPKIMGNPVQLTQVFLNLYLNALYAMKSCQQKKLSLSAQIKESDPAFLTINFSDTGSGIQSEVLPKVFDYGFSTKGEKGQGIGLNMCKTIINHFGGAISCRSEVAKGTTFIIMLPIAGSNK